MELPGFWSATVIDQVLQAVIGLMIFLSLLAMGMGLTIAEFGGALRRDGLLNPRVDISLAGRTVARHMAFSDLR